MVVIFLALASTSQETVLPGSFQILIMELNVFAAVHPQKMSSVAETVPCRGLVFITYNTITKDTETGIAMSLHFSAHQPQVTLFSSIRQTTPQACPAS